jgi:methionyl-tRNA formyltransferase
MNSAQEIYNQYRALSVWPKVYSYWKKDEKKPKKIIFHQISLSKDNQATKSKKPGEVIKTENKRIFIKAGKGLILIEKLQMENRKIVTIEEFLNGHPQFINATLG